MAEGIPEYEELKLRIDPGGDGGSYRVLALGPDGTAASGEFELPFSAMELDNFILRVGQPRRSVRARRSSHMQEAKQFGSTLFDALLQDDVLETYLGARRGAEAHGRGLRVTLYLTGVPELMEIPWEFLYERPSFLSQSIYTPVVRSLDLKNVRAPRKLTPPLQILGVVSTPTGFEGLDVEAEQRKLEEALSSLRAAGLVELSWLTRATMEELDRVIAAPDDVHVLHYIGHGAYDERKDSGILVLENLRGDPYEISGEELGTLLYDEHSLRLAVLNSCEGARTSHVEPFSGVAARLVECGVPAVVGMQFEITDDAAITFSERFYTSLAQGFPVDAALAQARKAIFAAGSDIEFGTPVLFLRGTDARLFDIEQAPALAGGATPTGPSDFSLQLEQHPLNAAPGEPVSWELTIVNTGACALREVTATGSDGRTLAELADIDVGRRGVVRWKDTLEPELGQLVTVAASDPAGSRISEQIVARPQSTAGSPPAEDPTKSPPPSEPPEPPRAGSANGHPRPTSRRRRPAPGWVIAFAALAIGSLFVAGTGVFSAEDEKDTPKPKRAQSGVAIDGVAIEGGGAVDAMAARGDLVVWERPDGNQRRLVARLSGKTRELPVKANDIAGLAVGVDSRGDLVAIYSSCTAPLVCDLRSYDFNRQRDRALVPLSSPNCAEIGPSLGAGVISFARGAPAGQPCRQGTYVTVGGQPRYFPGPSNGTHTDGHTLAWEPNERARQPKEGTLWVADLDKRSKPRPIVPPRGHRFYRPRVDGDYVYFVDRYLDRIEDDTFVIARTKVDDLADFEYYGPERTLSPKPALAVTRGELLYRGDTKANPRDGAEVIWRDRSPSFLRGLPDAR